MAEEEAFPPEVEEGIKTFVDFFVNYLNRTAEIADYLQKVAPVGSILRDAVLNECLTRIADDPRIVESVRPSRMALQMMMQSYIHISHTEKELQ